VKGKTVGCLQDLKSNCEYKKAWAFLCHDQATPRRLLVSLAFYLMTHPDTLHPPSVKERGQINPLIPPLQMSSPKQQPFARNFLCPKPCLCSGLAWINATCSPKPLYHSPFSTGIWWKARGSRQVQGETTHQLLSWTKQT